MYGIDWNGPLPSEEEADRVVVPECSVFLRDTDYEELTTLVDPNSMSVDYGLDLYLECLRFVSRVVRV